MAPRKKLWLVSDWYGNRQTKFYTEGEARAFLHMELDFFVRSLAFKHGGEWVWLEHHRGSNDFRPEINSEAKNYLLDISPAQA